ncbi:ABC transporter ATP-binding protein [Corynebacterium sp.]|uniref:ABC transporter ATP-binding protein n=1 Tax=Corynebacterium sp. TaxID=1720 RepID=UPI0026DCA2E1|nr:ATP-binding cassette domain-containing protein [Corynebacterium sp.]MDO5032370.1 ATP-binding cassette domain-containing protein [Corynebacterium sp.]
MVGIEVDAQNFGWSQAGREGFALRGVDLHVEPGERILLCGDSGSGKSTLLAALAGVLGGQDEGTQEGRILLRSEHYGQQEPGHEIPVGLVLQDPDSQVIANRVGDDVAFGCENLGVERQEIWRRVDKALDMVGLHLPVDHPTSRLSGGQKQRLALAGVLAMGAGLILLDEPTANLDPEGAAEVIEAVHAAVEATGATLIVVEHKYANWERFIPRAVVLKKGRVVEDGDFATVTAKRRVRPLASASKPAPGTPAALWTTGLVTRFGPPRTLELPEGHCTVITGANGTGKTTLLETIAGLLPAHGGKIGMSEAVRNGATGSPEQWSSKQLAHRIGYVFQNPEHQFVARSVMEEMRVGPKVMGEEIPQARIDELLERLHLARLAHANPFTLSGGEKRRLSVATALVSAPKVVLLDEPTFGQDPHTFAELVVMLRELTEAGTTLAAVTHDELFIEALGDHRVHLEAGHE